jgi:hypothetical protein
VQVGTKRERERESLREFKRIQESLRETELDRLREGEQKKHRGDIEEATPHEMWACASPQL